MHPVICHVGPFTIYSYGLLLVAAFLVASLLAAQQARQKGLVAQIVQDFSFVVLFAGILGARLAYIVINLDFFMHNPLEMVMLQHGGLVWYGGLAVGAGAGIIYLYRQKVDILRYADLIAPFVALGQAIGRLGCFFNGCCFGREAAWGMYFPAQDEVLIPTQLISSFLLVVIFLILRFAGESLLSFTFQKRLSDIYSIPKNICRSSPIHCDNPIF